MWTWPPAPPLDAPIRFTPADTPKFQPHAAKTRCLRPTDNPRLEAHRRWNILSGAFAVPWVPNRPFFHDSWLGLGLRSSTSVGRRCPKSLLGAHRPNGSVLAKRGSSLPITSGNRKNAAALAGCRGARWHQAQSHQAFSVRIPPSPSIANADSLHEHKRFCRSIFHQRFQRLAPQSFTRLPAIGRAAGRHSATRFSVTATKRRGRCSTSSLQSPDNTMYPSR